MKRPASWNRAREGLRRWALRIAAAAEGLSCALRTPAWIRGSGLRALTAAPASIRGPGSGRAARGWDRERVRWARRSARRALRLLARLPRSPWDDTCLYRSVAACLVGRRCGRPAVLAPGVRRGGGGRGPVEAHAWVEEPTGAATGASAPEGLPFRRLTTPGLAGRHEARHRGPAGRCP